ncbi:hypothetical protein MVEG_04664 [Podila verticillata NRRL 6337]|nr:hypothetical protein MVEG_04664 [Podila verticillata NRRL 6337]
MAEILHQCVAASGTHISLISLQRTRIATIPATFSHTLVLQSSSTQHQPSHSQTVTNQHILPTYNSRAPPSSPDYLGTLALGLSSGHASCQVAQGNFVFTTGSGSVLVTGFDPLSNTSIKAQWIRLRENTTLSIVFDKDQGLPSTTTTSTTITDEPLAQARVVPLEYTRTSPYGLTIHILGNHLDQTTRTLDVLLGTPRTMAYSNGALYILGSNRVMQIVAIDWTNTKTDGASQRTFLTRPNPTLFELPFLPQDCVASGSNLFSVASGRALYLFCSNNDTKTPYQIFIMEQGRLTRSIQHPWQGRVDSISVATTATGNTLLVTQSGRLVELELGTHRRVKRAPITTSMITSMDSSALSTTPSIFIATPSSSTIISPSISPSVDGDADSGSSDTVKGAVGTSAFIATLILTFVYCRYFRRRRTQAKIERIMQRNEPPQIVLPDVYNTNHMTPPTSTANLVHHSNNDPNAEGHYLYHPLPPTPAEQQIPEEHEMAHIEMQRQQLAPPPLIAYSMEGIAQPMAPPVGITETNNRSRSTAHLTSQTAPPPRAHPFARFEDPYGTQQFGEGHDVSVYAQKQQDQLQPHEAYGSMNYYPASSLASSSQSAGSSSGTGGYGYHSEQPSLKPEKPDHDPYSSVSSDMPSPPPPYIESITLQLHHPSAPSPLSEPPNRG